MFTLSEQLPVMTWKCLFTVHNIVFNFGRAIFIISYKRVINVKNVVAGNILCVLRAESVIATLERCPHSTYLSRAVLGDSYT